MSRILKWLHTSDMKWVTTPMGTGKALEKASLTCLSVPWLTPLSHPGEPNLTPGRPPLLAITSVHPTPPK